MKRKNIAAISSYKFGETEDDMYHAIFLYNDLDELKQQVEFQIRFLYYYYNPSLGVLSNDISDLLGLRKSYEPIKTQIETVFQNMSGKEKRVIIEIFDLFEEFHIELLGPINDELEWLNNTNESKIIRTLTEEFWGREGIQKVIGLSLIDDMGKTYYFENRGSSEIHDNKEKIIFNTSVVPVLE